jgi:hypothetical protein
MNSTQMINTGAAQVETRRSPCNCPEQTPPHLCCCNLVCFDRPNYFCGHLLTDADLTLQQRYVVEKNKLYHRTLDGYGVVCGLKLTCDCECKGNIRIHDGYAIDDCGNDLIVCETTRFDVIAALRSKNLLVTDPEGEDCEPRRHKSRCEIKQCFYVTICYEESESDYETPFQSSCTAGPKQCMPTRIHERVRFEVTDKLPHQASYLEDLEKRIRECFEINCDSPIGVIIKRHAAELLEIFGDGELEVRSERDPCELFCRLRAYFLNHLKVKPDQFNCGLFEEVSCLTCPGECRDGNDRRDGDSEVRRLYRDELREAFRKLLYCMQRYQYDCVFGDLIFSCQEPCEAHCLVLGTVEVVNGKLTRVCNTPRKYLWAPANLLQVLTYEVMSGRQSEERGCREDEHGATCCPSYPKFEPTEFLREFEVNQCGRRYAAESAIEAFRAVSTSLHHSFDFTDSMAYAPKLFADLLQRPRAAGEPPNNAFGVRASLAKTTAAELSALNPLQALMSRALLRPGDSVQGYPASDEIRVLPDFLGEISPDRSVGTQLETLFSEQARHMSELRAEIDALKQQIGKTQQEGRETQRPSKTAVDPGKAAPEPGKGSKKRGSP